LLAVGALSPFRLPPPPPPRDWLRYFGVRLRCAAAVHGFQLHTGIMFSIAVAMLSSLFEGAGQVAHGLSARRPLYCPTLAALGSSLDATPEVSCQVRPWQFNLSQDGGTPSLFQFLFFFSAIFRFFGLSN
jgi:hypothetical protein